MMFHYLLQPELFRFITHGFVFPTGWRSCQQKVKVGQWFHRDPWVQEAGNCNWVIKKKTESFVLSYVLFIIICVGQAFFYASFLHSSLSLWSCRDREMQFYDLSTLDPYCQITALDTVPLTIDYGYKSFTFKCIFKFKVTCPMRCYYHVVIFFFFIFSCRYSQTDKCCILYGDTEVNYTYISSEPNLSYM